MIAYNEAESLAVTLPQIKRAVDQVIVVDMGSTDGSADLYASCLDAHDEVALYPRDSLFRFGFAHARNYGAALARHDLIFAIDADEWIDPAELARARAIWFSADQPDFQLVSRRNYKTVPGLGLRDVTAIIASSPFTKEVHCRIYRKRRGLTWEGLLHEELRDEGLPTAQRYAPLPITLHHLSEYKSSASTGEKPYLYAYLLLRAVRYPDFRAGMGEIYFSDFIPQHLDDLVEHANAFALLHALPGFSKAQIEQHLHPREAASTGALSA